MGFREGEGLGKYGQGRKEIVEASTQRGRRGLGLTLKGFQGDLNVDWEDEPEVRHHCQNVSYKNRDTDFISPGPLFLPHFTSFLSAKCYRSRLVVSRRFSRDPRCRRAEGLDGFWTGIAAHIT